MIGIVLALLALGFFAYLWMGPKEDPEAGAPVGGALEGEQNAPDRAQIITAKHDYVDGLHAVAGEIPLPTPCEKLDAEAFFVEGNNANVEIQFTTTNLSEGDESCAQVITPARFKVEFEGPEDAAISATLNGEGAVLNLVPLPEGKNLDEFSEFMKG